MREYLYELLSGFLRLARLVLVMVACYLVQVCIVAPYVRIWGITPNLLLVTLAFVGVRRGNFPAFWSGCILGLLLEVMQPARPLLNLLLYPVDALLTSAVFSDKSETRLEYERSIGKAGRNLNPSFRVLCASALCSAVYETVQLTYIYLREDTLGMWGVTRSLKALAVTVLLTALALLLLRLLGVRFRQPEAKPTVYGVESSGSTGTLNP